MEGRGITTNKAGREREEGEVKIKTKEGGRRIVRREAASILQGCLFPTKDASTIPRTPPSTLFHYLSSTLPSCCSYHRKGGRLLVYEVRLSPVAGAFCTSRG